MDIFTISFCVLANCAVSSPMYFEKNLMRHLLDNYGDRAVRPVNDTSDAIHVQARFLVRQIIKFDEPIQQLIINVWLKLAWKDVYLQWEPKDWGNITNVSVFPDCIWKPDLTFYENVDEKWESIKDIEAGVSSDGTVTWFTPAILQISCKVKVRYFPFDYQRCNITMGSWRYDKSRLDIVALDDEDANQKVYDENGVWTLHHVEKSIIERKFKCCDHPYTVLALEITMIRNPGFYIYNILVPCVLLSIMTVFVFRLPPESGEKISLGMTNVLALILFQQLIAENMPPLGDEMPVIGVYFLSMIVMGCISVMTTVIVLRVYHYPDSKPIPYWLSYVTSQSLHIDKCNGASKVTNSSNIHDVNAHSSDIGLWAYATQTEGAKISGSSGKENAGDKDKEKTVSEWKHVAVLLDRFVFVVLLICMVVILLYVLIKYWGYWRTLEKVYKKAL